MSPKACSVVAATLFLASLGAPGDEPAPAAGKPTAVEGKARSADGIEIAYDTRGKGEVTLVFVHGWCGDRSFWREQLDVFAEKYRVVSLDLAGHGASGKDRAEWTADAFAADVEAVVKAADVKRAILVGHSMGGPISLLAAKRMPDRVAAVVGVDTLHNVEFKWPEEQTKQFLAMFDADFEGTTRMFLKGMLPADADPALAKYVMDKVLGADRKMATGAMRALTAFDAKAALAGAKVPVRCINAAPGLPFAIATAVDVNRKYGDFDVVLMEGVGHFPMLEKPKEFNEKLAEQLKKLETTPAKNE
ncbi:MAG TPA: alpha/beta fold hydrolase [Planctomycetota bacterium]|nr:alpha/beta fold hydrolase [Planctomycetota bacterium]